MALLREDGSLVQWLHVSKYPPSVTYDALELGIAWLLLALFLGSAPTGVGGRGAAAAGSERVLLLPPARASPGGRGARPPHARDAGTGDDLPVGGGGDRGAGPGLQRLPQVQGRPPAEHRAVHLSSEFRRNEVRGRRGSGRVGDDRPR